ncbi:hypothetical protein FM112_09040 [Gulosibacter sp. 10]|nr:hypothetical protein FM112_09040 [Gulosibacter sp. 10]
MRASSPAGRAAAASLLDRVGGRRGSRLPGAGPRSVGAAQTGPDVRRQLQDASHFVVMREP